MPDDQDPNLSDLQARAWDRSSSYISDPDLHPDADYHVLLEIDNSSFLDFKGITLHTGIFEFNEATNLNFDEMRFLYPTYDGRMLKDGQLPLYNNRIQPVSLKGRPDLDEVPDSNISFTVTDYESFVKVEFKGIVPDLFQEGSGVVALGYLNDEVFYAEEVLAKHDENYMPPNIEINNDS